MSISKILKPVLLASFILLMIFGVNATETHAQSGYSFCNTSNTLKLYSGYSSMGQAHLRREVVSLQRAIIDQYDPGLYFTHDTKLTKMPDIGGADGYFGSNTRNAVIVIQQIHGIDVDGKVGPQTRRVMCSPIADALAAKARKQ